jgi:hypothetical protein
VAKRSNLYDAMGQCDFGDCMRFARGFIGAYRLCVAHGGGELSEKNGRSAVLSMFCPERLYFHESHLWHSSSHVRGASTRSHRRVPAGNGRRRSRRRPTRLSHRFAHQSGRCRGRGREGGSSYQVAARGLRVELLILNARSKDEIEAAFVSLGQQRVGALLVGADSIFRTQNDQIVALAARYAIPTSYEPTLSTTVGGLMSYGTDLVETSRMLGVYAGRILRGVKPSDLPVMQPTKFVSSSISKPPRHSASRFRPNC